LEGCSRHLGLPDGALEDKGFKLVNAPLAAAFTSTLLSLLFFAAESLRLVGQWGRRPMFALYPNSKAYRCPVWGEFCWRAFHAARMLIWPAVGGQRPPVMLEWFINLLHQGAQDYHQDTHTGVRVVEGLLALFSAPDAARGLALHLSASSTQAAAEVQLEAGSRGKAVVGDTPGLSLGAAVDGRKLAHASGNGVRTVRWGCSCFVVAMFGQLRSDSTSSTIARMRAEPCRVLSPPFPKTLQRGGQPGLRRRRQLALAHLGLHQPPGRGVQLSAADARGGGGMGAGWAAGRHPRRAHHRAGLARVLARRQARAGTRRPRPRADGRGSNQPVHAEWWQQLERQPSEPG
jgi:hypothetical protein